MTTNALMELAACPFCKRSNSTSDPHALEVYPCDGDYQVRCGHCVAFGPMRSSEEGAVEAWNQLRTAAAEGGDEPFAYARQTSVNELKSGRCSGITCGEYSEMYERTVPLYLHPPSAGVAGRDGMVIVPKEVRELYDFMVMAFAPFTSQQEQIAISLKKAKAAMKDAIAGAAGEPR